MIVSLDSDARVCLGIQSEQQRLFLKDEWQVPTNLKGGREGGWATAIRKAKALSRIATANGDMLTL
jgi:hypothetical protein